jgi:hypothetical protein
MVPENCWIMDVYGCLFSQVLISIVGFDPSLVQPLFGGMKFMGKSMGKSETKRF